MLLSKPTFHNPLRNHLSRSRRFDELIPTICASQMSPNRPEGSDLVEERTEPGGWAGKIRRRDRSGRAVGEVGGTNGGDAPAAEGRGTRDRRRWRAPPPCRPAAWLASAAPRPSPTPGTRGADGARRWWWWEWTLWRARRASPELQF